MSLTEYIEDNNLSVDDKAYKHMEGFIERYVENKGEVDFNDEFVDTSLKLIVNPGMELNEDIKDIIIDGCKEGFRFNLFLCTMDKIKKAFDDVKEASPEKYMEFLDIYKAALNEEIDLKDMGLYLVGRKAFDKDNSSVFAGSEIRKAFNDMLIGKLNSSLKKSEEDKFTKDDINDLVLDCHLRNLRNMLDNNTAIKNLKENKPETYRDLVNSFVVSEKVSADEYDRYLGVLNLVRIPNMEKVIKLYMNNLAPARRKLTEHIDRGVCKYFVSCPDYIRTHFKLKFFIMSNTFDENSEEGLKAVSDNIAISTSENPDAASMFSIYNYIFYVLRDSFGVYTYNDYEGASFGPEKILDTGSKYKDLIDLLERYINYLKETVYAENEYINKSSIKNIILGYYYRDLYRYFTYNPEIAGMFKTIEGADEETYLELLDDIEADANTITNIDLFDYVKEEIPTLDKTLSDYFFSTKITGPTDVEPAPSPEFNMLGGEIATLESVIDNCSNIMADTSGSRTSAEKEEKRMLRDKTEVELKDVLKRRNEIKLRDRGAYDAECLRQVAVFNNYKDENIKNLYMMIKNPIALREEIIAKQKEEEEASKKKKKKKKK